MTDFKTSVAWWCFARNLSADELIDASVGLGYEGIEFAPREHWRRITDAGLTIAATGGHASIGEGLNRRENHDRIARELNENLGLAQRWGIPSLICFSGNRDGLDDEIGADHVIEGLRRVAPTAEAAGVTLLLELLNSRVDHPGYQADRTEWGARVCAAVGSPRVKLLYDIYHMQIMEGDVIRAIQRHHDQIGHYHVAGNPGRHEPDGAQELNYPAIYAAIRGTGYAGFVGMEFLPSGDPIEALRAARAACRGLALPVA